MSTTMFKEATKLQGLETMDAKKFHEKMILHELNKYRESGAREYGIDFQKIPWSSGRVPFRELLHNILTEARSGNAKFREAESPTAWGQLQRYGVSNYMFNAYLQTPTVYERMVQVRPSSGAFEWYAPMFRAQMPTTIVSGQRFRESRLTGLDVIVKNKKTGRILAIDRDLFDDDQTGQLAQKASQMGEATKIKEEIDFLVALRSGPYTTGLGNSYGSNIPMNQPLVEAAAIALSQITDPTGNKILVKPDVLLGGPNYQFAVMKLMKSAYTTAVPGVYGTENLSQSPGIASGEIGWTMTDNVIKGLYDPQWSYYMNATEWYLAQSRVSLVQQDRHPLEVLQENPQSGASFEYDEVRFRVKRRYAFALIDSRFIYQGSTT